MTYFTATLWAMHMAIMEELIVTGVAVAENVTDCATTPEAADCNQCSIVQHGRRPPYPEPPTRTDFFAQIVNRHHNCADANTATRRTEFTATYGNLRRSFDTTELISPDDPSLAGGGEVKTTASTFWFPGPSALGYFLVALSVQIPEQREIAVGCKFSYELIVQEFWQMLLAETLQPGVTVVKNCPSIATDPPSTTGVAALLHLNDLAEAYLDAWE